MLEPHLRDKSIYPDEKLPFTVKSSIRNLEIEVAAIRFGLDSLQFRHACARMDEVIKEEMDKERKNAGMRKKTIEIDQWRANRPVGCIPLANSHARIGGFNLSRAEYYAITAIPTMRDKVSRPSIRLLSPRIRAKLTITCTNFLDKVHRIQ